MNFNQSIQHSATEFYLLRQRVEYPPTFDKAVKWMHDKKFRVDLKRGRVLNVDGVQSQFVNYDWADNYEDAPNLVFGDFFRGFLLNKYSRIVRGLDQS